ncbi:MAG: diguanylate cyclase [Pseudomonadales bacterium]|nr:diguanylate cyclase [Pseudomonadales bacterium]
MTAMTSGWITAHLPWLAVVLVLLAWLGYREWRLARLRQHQLALLQQLGDARRVMHDGNRELHQLFEHANVVVMLVDREERQVVYANALAQQRFGVTSVAAMTRDVLRRPQAWGEPPYSLQDFDNCLERAGRLGGQRFEWQLPNPQGRPVWLDASLASIPYQGRQVMMFTGVDISNYKAAKTADWLRNRALVAMTGDRGLSETLDLIVSMIQFVLPNGVCAIMLMEPESRTLGWGSRMQLPESLQTALASLPVVHGGAASGTAAAIQERVVSEDIDADDRWSRYREPARQAGLKSCWSEPILGADGALLGTLDVYHSYPWKPSEADLEACHGPLFLAGLAIERHQARDRLQRLVAAEQSIRQVSEKLQTVETGQTNQGIVEVLAFLADYLRVDQCQVFWVSGEHFVVSHCWPAAPEEGQDVPAVLSRQELAMLDGQEFAVLNHDGDGPQLLSRLMPEQRAQTALLIPMIQGDQLAGVLVFCSGDRERVWPRLELNTAAPIAALIGNAIGRQQLMDQLTHQALHDRLTGLFNRAKMEDQLQQEIHRAHRYGSVFSLVLFDVDHFKSVNDRFGHDAGDAVLQVVAGQLRNNVRAADLVARWGGEEFLVLLPETTMEAAWDVAEHLRQSVAGAEVPIPGGQVTVSAGVSAFQPGEQSVETAIKRADLGLYQAKEAGRNRVQLSA